MAEYQEQNDRQLMIVDADPGVDDAQAILMGLSDRKWQVLAIFTHYGSTTLENTTENCVKFLAALYKTEVPVYKCSERPLVVSPHRALFGNDGFGDHDDLPSSTEDLAQSENGILAMIRLVKEHPGEITLLGLGPLTDLAMAHRFYPAFSKKLKSCFIMGGNYKGRGNITRCAEFNFFMDPEAANIVLTEFECPISLFPWELCYESALPWKFRDQLYEIPGLKTRVMKKLEAKLIDQWKSCGPYVMCDELAMAGILDEKCMAKCEQVSVEVELSGKLTRGQVVVDWEDATKKAKTVRLVTQMDMELVKNLLLRTYRELIEAYV